MTDTAAGVETETETEPAQSRRGPWSRVGAVLSTLALGVVVLVALAMIVVPALLRATPYTVLTGSMAPTIPPGSLVVVRPAPFEDLEMGDVVTYQLRSGEATVVTHRVVGVGTRGDGETVLTTRGDANDAPDLDPVSEVQVRGAVAYHLPYLGYVNLWVGVNRPGWLLKTVAGLLIGYGVVLVLGGLRDRLRRRSDDAAPDDAAPDDGAQIEGGAS